MNNTQTFPSLQQAKKQEKLFHRASNAEFCVNAKLNKAKDFKTNWSAFAKREQGTKNKNRKQNKNEKQIKL